VGSREQWSGAGVNEKTPANPRNWPLIRGHLAPQGDRFAGFALFFQSGRKFRSRLIFGTFDQQKYKRKNLFLIQLSRN